MKRFAAGTCLVLVVIMAVVVVSTVSGDYVDPDVRRNFTQIIEAKGYPCETHYVTTEDGYILTLFRMPYGKSGPSSEPRPVAVLQHGLLDSSFTWIVNEPTESLSYILADHGYDVWMLNSRGNTYSNSHVNMSNTDPAFWAFSWDEMAKYDLPANTKYILEYTGRQNFSYIGHSQGTLTFFAALSVNPEMRVYYNTFVGLGPVATVGHITNELLRLLAEFDFLDLVKLFGFNQFLPSAKWLNELFPYVCREDGGLCSSVIEYICGPHQGAFNNTRMQVVAAHEPGGTSVQNVAHFAQCIKSDLFQAYDYGSTSANLAHYNSTTPPVYNITNFPVKQLPTALFYGSVDELADPTDVAWLLGNLQSPPILAQELQGFAHLDFVWDIDAYYIFYPTIIQLLDTYSSS